MQIRHDPIIAQYAIDFIQELTHTKGKWAGKPFVLLPWQVDLISRLFGTVYENDKRVYSKCYVEIPKKMGKALALNTPIPVSNGWSTIGDIKSGDDVLDENGNHCKVVAITDVQYNRPCYKVSFSDGSSIVADAEHEWRIEVEKAITFQGSTTFVESIIYTTQDIAENSSDDYYIKKRNHNEYYLYSYIEIVDVKPIPSVPVKCIQVDSLSHMYLAGKSMIPTHNSELAAAIALFLLFADGEMGGEVYGAAADRKQASIVFDVARQMVLNSPDLNPDNNPAVGITASQKRIYYRETNSYYDVLSADVNTKHGFNIHGCIFDELHAQPKRDLWDVLTEGAGDAREQPLTFAITTAGYDRNSICWEVHEQAMDIKNGVYENENFLPIIYALDEKDDWKDEKNWYKVNPSLDVTVDIEKVRTAFREAEHIPAKQNAFKRLRLCQWTQQSDRFIDMNLWDSQAGNPINESELLGQQGCGGLDLSSVSDLTAWVMIFKQAYTEKIDILCRFWCPKARIYADNNKYKDRYQSWERDGYLIATPGDAIDYQFVKAQVIADCKKFNIVAMNVDRLWQGHQLTMELEDELDGITEVAWMHMGHTSYAVPMKDFERNLLEGRLHHGGNPVLRFCADHLTVKMNEPGDVKPDKATSQGKIDGIVALVMAFDQLSRHASDTESVYETQGLFVLGDEEQIEVNNNERYTTVTL